LISYNQPFYQELYRVYLVSRFRVDIETKKIFRDYAWGYFKLHADQRLQSFNFFLIVAGLLAGGITSLLKEGGSTWWVAALLGLTLAVLSLVFWRLEERTKHLVKNAEEALKYLDSQEGFPDEQEISHVLRLFDHDDYVVRERRWHLSYSKCLTIVFFVFAILGVVLIFASFLVSVSPCSPAR
jgi:hypothetical protein